MTPLDLERACRRLDDAERDYHNVREVYLSHVTRGLIHSLPELRSVLRKVHRNLLDELEAFHELWLDLS